MNLEAIDAVTQETSMFDLFGIISPFLEPLRYTFPSLYTYAEDCKIIKNDLQIVLDIFDRIQKDPLLANELRDCNLKWTIEILAPAPPPEDVDDYEDYSNEYYGWLRCNFQLKHDVVTYSFCGSPALLDKSDKTFQHEESEEFINYIIAQLSCGADQTYSFWFDEMRVYNNDGNPYSDRFSNNVEKNIKRILNINRIEATIPRFDLEKYEKEVAEYRTFQTGGNYNPYHRR